jgi:hypothetical protein
MHIVKYFRPTFANVVDVLSDLEVELFGTHSIVQSTSSRISDTYITTDIAHHQKEMNNYVESKY